MKISLLGGNGFLGRHLCLALLKRGHFVTVLDKPGTKPPSHASCAGRLHWCEGNFLNSSDVAKAIDGADIVFHLVSTSLPANSNSNPIADASENLVGTLQLLEKARFQGVGRIIFISSGGTVYGRPKYTPIDEDHPTNPICSYGIGKLTIEKYLALYKELHGLEFTILRLANPYGEGQRVNAPQGVVAVFLARAMQGQPIEIWGDGSVCRDYIHISDVIGALVSATTYQGDEKVINIGSGCGKSVAEVITAIQEVTGLSITKKLLPARKFDVPTNILSIERARRELCWEPKVTFNEGLSLFYSHLQRAFAEEVFLPDPGDS